MTAKKRPEDTTKWTVNKWKELDNFVCRECPFATIVFDRMLIHVADGHHPVVVGPTSTQEGQIVAKNPEALGKILLELPDAPPEDDAGKADEAPVGDTE